MPTVNRKVEVYRLTISGLEDGTNYTIYLRDILKKAEVIASQHRFLLTVGIVNIFGPPNA
jgi:hypothetical protein